MPRPVWHVCVISSMSHGIAADCLASQPDNPAVHITRCTSIPCFVFATLRRLPTDSVDLIAYSVVALQLWLVDYFYLIAGILFALAGAFYCMHEISPWLIPGADS